MLTKLRVIGFKKFDDIEVPLGNPVVFVGPNDSGKTSVLQCLTLWEAGLKKWLERRGGREIKRKKGVTIDIKELMNIPMKEANLLWKDTKVRFGRQKPDGTPFTENILIGIIVEGVIKGFKWTVGLEFDYRDPGNIYCRPLRLDNKGEKRMDVPEEAADNEAEFAAPIPI